MYIEIKDITLDINGVKALKDVNFTPNFSSTWTNCNIHESGPYPVKPKNLYISENGESGIKAQIIKIEYQGMEMSVLLSLKNGEILEIKQLGNRDFKLGDEVILTI